MDCREPLSPLDHDCPARTYRSPSFARALRFTIGLVIWVSAIFGGWGLVWVVTQGIDDVLALLGAA